MIRLRSREDIVGASHHRAGWAYAMQCIEGLESPDGILFDDFVDRSFGWEPIANPYQEPWVGVFHKPPGWPPWLGIPSMANTPERLVRSELFQAALPQLKLAITLSRRVANWLRQEIRVQVVTASHPTPLDVPQFNESAYFHNSSKQLVQIGYVLRNLRAIYQLPVPLGFTKARIVIRNPSADRSEGQVRDYWSRLGGRSEIGHVTEYGRIPNIAYDDLLTKNVVLLELFDASVNNTMLECLVRATPIIVNRLPALEEHLGEAYPLFYDDFAEANSLLTDEKIIEGHRYLKRLDRTLYSGERFLRTIDLALREIPGATAT